jgi:hypothetical protein
MFVEESGMNFQARRRLFSNTLLQVSTGLPRTGQRTGRHAVYPVPGPPPLQCVVCGSGCSDRSRYIPTTTVC